MRITFTAFVILLFAGTAFAQIATEGGNVTQLNVSGTLNSTFWDGVYGEVVLGAATNYSYTVVGNGVARLNLVARDPNCTYTGLTMHVIAVNGTTLTTPLSAGNLPQLDAFVGIGTENGSRTFTTTSTFSLTYGTFVNVPTAYTYANNASSPDFREGYLNDAAGNLVFVAVIVDNRPDWNGTTSDYQIMLPMNGTATNYTLWVDVNYTCQNGTIPSDGHNEHILYIYPPGIFTVNAGDAFNPSILVENRGNYMERDIDVYISRCPAGFTCGSALIDELNAYEQEAVSFPITVDGVGEYVLTVCARNLVAHTCRDFIVDVVAECAADGDCGGDEYCDNGACEPKKKVNEECERDGQCESNACESGKCVFCTGNDDCAFDEACVGGICEKIECACGYISSHACISYECCADTDCSASEFCISHLCVAKELEILVVEGEAIEGESLLVQIVNNKGEIVPFAKVFTDYMTVYADENGYATIGVPYNGMLYAARDGYPQAGLMLSVTKKGFFVAEEEIIAGQETAMRVVDSRGNGINGATVFVEGETVETDSQGYFPHTFETSGTKILKGRRTGYLIGDREIDVLAGAIPVCSFPVMLNLFLIPPASLYLLWLVSIVLALANFAMSARRLKVRPMIKGAIYSFAPLLLALPGINIFSICFMSNVVLIQAIIETAMLARKLREKKTGNEAAGKKKKE
ncbi:hypothetical protein H0O02_00405 [Candidatus Micrarchaeota archaeon]|nr:hypothetical protein [Candidatus Micrarchaeota archaeon]